MHAQPEHKRGGVVRCGARQREIFELGLDHVEARARGEVEQHAEQAVLTSSLPASEHASAEQVALQRRQLAVTGPVLPAGTVLRLATRVVVAPEERAGLVVVAALCRQAQPRQHVALGFDLVGLAQDVPGVAVAAERRSDDHVQRTHVVLRLEGPGEARTVFGMMLLRHLTGRTDHHSAVGVAQKTVVQAK